MKLFLILFAVISLLSAQKSSVDNRIKSSKRSLQHTKKEHRHINSQLNRIAKSIRRQREELAKMEKILDDLAIEQNRSREKYDMTKKRLNDFEDRISKIDGVIKSKERDFERLLKEQFAMVVAMEELNITTERAVIIKEFYEASKKVNEKELAQLKEIIKNSSEKKKELHKVYIALKLSIANLETKRRVYENKKRKVEKLLTKLKRDEELYRKKLSAIMDRQSQLRKTLAKLNILKKDEVARIEKLERMRKAQLARRAKAMNALRDKTSKARRKARARGESVNYSAVNFKGAGAKSKARSHSYQKSLVSKYRGSKTISPIKNAKIARKFGTYIDPIYKMKIFNDALILRAPHKGAKVRAILNGKVVYVGENSVMGKVIIIQHSNHLHTTYSGLAGISPLIKTGKRVVKGTPIGIVKRKLIFRATQNSKFIDPLKLINL